MAPSPYQMLGDSSSTGGISSSFNFSERIKPSQDQLTTIYVIIGYTFGIALLWNLPYVKHILLPFKVKSYQKNTFTAGPPPLTTPAHLISSPLRLSL